MGFLLLVRPVFVFLPGYKQKPHSSVCKKWGFIFSGPYATFRVDGIGELGFQRDDSKVGDFVKAIRLPFVNKR
jgi:hypothetical protein